MNRADRAEELFRQGYNCSQSVFAAFADELGMTTEEAARIASPFGAGFGKLREVCGAVSGMTLIAGYMGGYSDPSDHDGKKNLYAMIRKMCSEFEAEQGSIICRKLLGLEKGEDIEEPAVRTEDYYQRRPCIGACRTAAEITEKMIPALKEMKTPGSDSSEWMFGESKQGGAAVIAYEGDRPLAGTIRIPAIYNNDSVTELGSRLFCEYKQIEEVILPDTVTKIGDAAFAICNSLSRINYPEGLEIIPADCFNECGFTNIRIPDTVKRIRRGAFVNNRQLVSASLPDSLKEIELMTFAGCISLKHIEIPDGVRVIGNGSFSGCSSLEEVTIPQSVEEIGSMAFLACRSLKKIVLPSRSVVIGDMAFPETTELIYPE